MEVILVRHTSVAVPKGTCYGQTDVPVRDTFEQEAQETLNVLRHFMPFDKAYSSPLTRARKLAAFCGFADAELDRRLMEMNMGEWEMHIYDEIKDPRLKDWYQDYMVMSTTGGEGFPQLYNRVAQFLDELKERDYRSVVIFAHGGVLISAGLYAGLYTEEDAWDHLVPFGGMIKITI